MNIYLDIDGVLIGKGGQAASHVVEFLEYVTDRHQVYWLTTHCKGDAKTAVHYLRSILPAETIPFLEKIKATDWQTLKTEAIDFNQDFRWLDDYAMQAELDILAKSSALEKLILINLKEEPSTLNILIKSL